MRTTLIRSVLAAAFIAAAAYAQSTGRISGTVVDPAGAAIVNALGPIRQIVQGESRVQRRYLVVVPGTADDHGAPVQIQVSK